MSESVLTDYRVGNECRPEIPIRLEPLYLLTKSFISDSSQGLTDSEGFQAQPSLKLTPFPPEGYFQLMALAPIL
jgi:hypothetical protein